MSLVVLALLLSSAWAAILNHTNDPQFPPNMVPYVLRAKEQHCPNSNATVLITLDKRVEGLRAELVKAVPGKIIIGNERLLFKKSIPKVECGIILVNGYITQLEYAWINFKAIVLVRVKNLQHNFGYGGTHLHQIYIMYTKTTYRAFGRVPYERNDLLLVMYYPAVATSKAFEHIWITMIYRYNITVLSPIPARLDAVSAYSAGIFSLKRTEHVICYLVPIKSKRPLEYVLIFPFDVPTWLLLALVTVLTMILLWSFPGAPRALMAIIFDLIQGVLSSPNLHIDSSFERNILQMFMFAVLIFVSTYLSLITAFITTPFYYNQYETLDQINNSCNVALGFVQDTSIFNFKHVVDYLTAIKQDYPVCLPISCHFTRKVDKSYTMGGKPYCMSRARSHRQPLLGITTNLKYHRMAQFIASTFVEAELYHFDDDWQLSTNDETPITQVKPFDLQDLKIVWNFTCKGWIISGFAFILELLLSCLSRIFPARPLVIQ